MGGRLLETREYLFDNLIELELERVIRTVWSYTLFLVLTKMNRQKQQEQALFLRNICFLFPEERAFSKNGETDLIF